jgi:alpha-tubulin suppressor-like RCC1 family protein
LAGVSLAVVSASTIFVVPVSEGLTLAATARHSGIVGRFTFADAPAQGSYSSCGYKGQALASITLPKAPLASMSPYWHEAAHGGWDGQRVGWQVALQRQVPGGRWTTILTHAQKRSSIQALLFGNGPHPESVRMRNLPGFRGNLAGANLASSFRLVETIEWYKPSRTRSAVVDGRASAVVSHYRDPSTKRRMGLCPGRKPCPGCVFAWGSANGNALGNTSVNVEDDSDKPAEVPRLSNVVASVGGEDDGYALSKTGEVYAWGWNGSGQLGDGRASPEQPLATAPVRVHGLSHVVALASGAETAYALTSSGRVYSWGSNTDASLGDGELSQGYSDVPVPVSGLANVKSIAAAIGSAYALTSGGVVYAWGANTQGQLGDGNAPSVESASDVPVKVSGLTNVAAIAGGGSNGYALTSSGGVYSWGAGDTGQLGNGQTGFADTPVPVSGLTNITAIGASGTNGFAVTGSGSVYAWGSNVNGALGDGQDSSSQHSSDTPVAVVGVADARYVGGGSNSQASFVITRSGHLRAWGSNEHGTLGTGIPEGSKPYSDVPITVDTPGQVVAAGMAGFAAYAVTSSGHLLSWGDNQEGELGVGVQSSYTGTGIPVRVGSLTHVVQVAAGFYSSAALTSSGEVYDWGSNGGGQLGDGSTSPSTRVERVVQISGIAQIAQSAQAGFAVARSGAVFGWGDHTLLGANAPPGVNDVPVQIAGLSGVRQVAAGYETAYALTTTGVVYAWGSNENGALGDGNSQSAEGSRVTPVQLSGLSDIVQIAAGTFGGYALSRTGVIYSWGDNSVGELGDGLLPPAEALRLTPAPLTGLPPVTAISASWSFASAGGVDGYALTGSGKVYVWGVNARGSLGDGTTPEDHTLSATPHPVVGLPRVVAIAPNGAIGTNHLLYTWGTNFFNNLADGKTAFQQGYSDRAVVATELSNIKAWSGSGTNGFAVVNF